MIIYGIDAKFLVLHEGKNEEAIRNFLNEVYELFVKVKKDN